MSANTNSTKANLARLCHRLLDEVDADQLRQIGRELHLGDEVIQEVTDPLTILKVRQFVAEIDQTGNISGFLNAFKQKGLDFRSDVFPAPTDQWVPSPLPQSVIDMLNEHVGLKGSPYLTLQFVTQIGEAGFQETGCYWWPMRDTSRLLHATPPVSFIVELDQIRGWLSTEGVFAYIGDNKTWGSSGLRQFPCVVVVPSTDQFDALRIEQTSGGNANIPVDELIEELESAHSKFGLDIIEANNVEVKFRTSRSSAEQYSEFCSWLKGFSPLGYEELEDYESQFSGSSTLIVRLWWD